MKRPGQVKFFGNKFGKSYPGQKLQTRSVCHGGNRLCAVGIVNNSSIIRLYYLHNTNKEKWRKCERPTCPFTCKYGHENRISS